MAFPVILRSFNFIPRLIRRAEPASAPSLAAKGNLLTVSRIVAAALYFVIFFLIFLAGLLFIRQQKSPH